MEPDERLLEWIARAATSLERIAAADEQRNELLKLDREERRRMWREDREDRAALRRQAFGDPEDATNG